MVSFPQFFDKVCMIPYKLGGRDYKGIDCWGLVVLAYKELFNLDIPTYDGTMSSVSNKNTKTAEDIINHLELSAPFTRVEEPQYGDFVLINILGNPTHIGLMIDSSHMLHISDKSGIAYEDIRSIKWQRRIQGFYRHNQNL